jgi:hypothetical protein
MYKNKIDTTSESIQNLNLKGSFNVENKNIIIEKIINFDLIKLMYELNPDIFEKVYLEKINDKEAILTLILKNLFEDLGIPQNYLHLNIKKKENVFEFTTIHDKPFNITNDLKLLETTIIYKYELKNDHNAIFNYIIYFEGNNDLNPFVTNIFSKIFTKVLKRLKQFIENITIT